MQQQDKSKDDDYHGRHFRTRALATPVGHGWAFHEGAKEEEAAVALTEQDKESPVEAPSPNDKATTPLGHGWSYGEKETVVGAAADAASPAEGGDKGKTPMGHGWALEGGAKDATAAEVVAPTEDDKGTTPLGHGWTYGEKEAVPDKANTPIGHGWVMGEKEAVPDKEEEEAVPDKANTPIGHGWAMGEKDVKDVALP